MSRAEAKSCEAEKSIPKIVHMIWVGGPIPDKYMSTLYTMAVLCKRSGFELRLLMDSKSDFARSVVRSRYDFSDFARNNLKLVLVEDMLVDAKSSKFYKDNDDLYKKFIRYSSVEGVGLKNLAAQADWYRYELLRQHGGFYMDMDTIICSANQLEKGSTLMLKTVSPKLGILINSRIHKDSFFHTGNDLIASLPEHPVMQEMVRYMVSQSEYLDSMRMPKRFGSKDCISFFMMKRMPLPHDDFGYLRKVPNNRFALTLRVSGPNALSTMTYNWIKSLGETELCLRDAIFPWVEFETVSFAGVHVSSESDGSWLKDSGARIKCVEGDAALAYKLR